jgi:hypothetical protein
MKQNEPLVSFPEVFAWELNALAGKVVPVEPGATVNLDDVYQVAQEQQLAGLALSGGGIRSATFNLGVLQALADLKLLDKFHYLSTVSGGGYIGGWLSKWIHTAGGVEQVQRALQSTVDGKAPRAEPPEVQFLRKYSNYLTPQAGLFTADTWTLICTYIRNTALNLIMLVAWMSVLFLLPRIGLIIGQCIRSLPREWVAGVSAVVFLVAVFSMALNVSLKGPSLKYYTWLQPQLWVLGSVCLPLMLAGYLGSIAVIQYRDRMVDYLATLDPTSIRATWLLVPGVVYFIFWGLGWGQAQRLNAHAAEKVGERRGRPVPRRVWQQALPEAFGHAVCAVGALAVGTLLMVLICDNVSESLEEVSNVHLMALGMPAMLLLFGITMTLMIGLIGRLYSDASREWWARQGAWTVILATASLVVSAATFYLPPLLAWAFATYWKSATLATAGTTLITYLGLRSGSGPSTGNPGKAGRLDLVAKVAPYAFTLLFLGLLTTGLMSVIGKGLPEVIYPACFKHLDSLPYFFAEHVAASEGYGWGAILPVLGICAVVALLLGWRLDINKFSLYMMYRLRLARAYFGASNKVRTPHPFTGFDPQDDLPLHDLLHPQAKGTEPAPPGPVVKPYHLFNTAVNLVHGKELAWQTRKAANFCFSPRYSGFELPPGRASRGGFRPTEKYASKSWLGDESDNGIKLGTAVAVSGAAASPNMGYHSSPPLSFLMTLFNLRLGRWSPNPARASWRRSSPTIGLISIVKELFGLTDAESKFVYLSDGGHFENLGLYELVRRRCQLIVVIDASCDNADNFDDLGNAIRKCQTDFNVPILLDVGGLPGKVAGDIPRRSFVTGRILYHDADGGDQEGVLLYIKPAVTGGENADVFNYSRLHPEFPHESTADQWFDENQFDSYRSLGRYIALRALKSAVAAADKAGSSRDAKDYVTRLSDALATPQAPQGARRCASKRKARPARKV